jgi:hypothetical protein
MGVVAPVSADIPNILYGNRKSSTSGPFYTVVFFPKSYEFSGIQRNSAEKFN